MSMRVILDNSTLDLGLLNEQAMAVLVVGRGMGSYVK